jgi:hypothetical protein
MKSGIEELSDNLRRLREDVEAHVQATFAALMTA